MTFATATINNSPTPAKDLMAALNAPLTAGGLTFVETYGTPPVSTWISVCFGGGQYVAFAQSTATAATSPDGITWTQRSLPASVQWQSVTYGGGVYVAIAYSTNIAATSPDGITWTLRTLPVIANWTSAAYGAGVFVAVATGGSIAATSPDGITWTQRTLPGGNLGWSSVCFGNGIFAAVNSSVAATAAASSPDGITWTQRVTVGAASWTSVTFGGTLFVAVNNGGAVANTSPDGITWTSRTIPTSAYTSVTYGNSLYVAVSGTQVSSSADGISWGTARTLPTAQGWLSVAYGAGVFTVMPGSTAATALTSPDAQTWTARTLTNTSAAATADVYKSPAASNQFGQDWYLILERNTDYATQVFYQVAEGYNATTHRASGLGGQGINVIPLPASYVNPTVPTAPELSVAASSYLLLTVGTPFTWWASASANRVVIGAKTSTEQGFYAGLYDDLLPAGVTGFPLVCAKLPPALAGGNQIGGASIQQQGGFTREPLQALPSALNFEARIHTGANPAATAQPGNFTPTTTTTALYGNPCTVSRALIGTGRTATTTADGTRGLLIGCVTSTVLSVIGDTVTSGGKTYVRMAGYATNFGVFADQAL